MSPPCIRKKMIPTITQIAIVIIADAEACALYDSSVRPEFTAGSFIFRSSMVLHLFSFDIDMGGRSSRDIIFMPSSRFPRIPPQSGTAQPPTAGGAPQRQACGRWSACQKPTLGFRPITRAHPRNLPHGETKAFRYYYGFSSPSPNLRNWQRRMRAFALPIFPGHAPQGKKIPNRFFTKKTAK